MITYSKKEFIKELKTLWHETFGDSEQYLNAFFESVYKGENTLVYIKDKRVVSALYIIPYTMLYKGREIKVAYLYALATNPAYRGRGIMGELIERSFEICKSRGYSLITLIPSEHSLFGYYERFGFKAIFSRTVITKDINEAENIALNHSPIKLKKCDADMIFNAYRQSEFYKSGCVRINKEQNFFYVNELIRESGTAAVFDMNGKNDGYILFSTDEEKLVIYESNVNESFLGALYAALAKDYTFKLIEHIQPICFEKVEIMAAEKPFAMAKSFEKLCISNPFINRVLT
ncbi:MAG TPA: GNAT family N-acetyltransferase [Oscillospiraceae bacterium]|nr:GNAT family N-acetyltransferase [Oscillospiraceae bacterium]